MENLFLAADLNDSVKAQMRSVRASASRLLDFGFRPVPDDCMHLSIQSLGRYDRISDALIERALRMGSRVEVPAFLATFDRLQGFNGTHGRAVVLTSKRPADGFLTLRKAIWAEMQLAGMDVPPSLDFSPHVSLAYQQTRNPDDPGQVGHVDGARACPDQEPDRAQQAYLPRPLAALGAIRADRLIID